MACDWRRILRIIAMLMSVAVLAMACSGDKEDDAARSVLDLGETFSPANGGEQCLDVGPDVGAQVSELSFTDCNVAHTHEIYAVLSSEKDTYPGFEELELEAQLACLTAFEDVIGVSAFDSDLFYSWIVPSLGSWQDEADREIICVAGAKGGGDLLESVIPG